MSLAQHLLILYVTRYHGDLDASSHSWKAASWRNIASMLTAGLNSRFNKHMIINNNIIIIIHK